MNYIKPIILLFFLSTLAQLIAQNSVGVGTSNPDRILDVEGFGPIRGRVQSTTGGPSMQAGLLLLRGGLENGRDYQLLNANGNFQIMTSVDNFNTSEQLMRISQAGNVKLGQSTGLTKMHVEGNEDVSLSNDGYLLIGNKSGNNLIFDSNEIQARNNGSAAPLVFQPEGGDVVLQLNGGHSYLTPFAGSTTAGDASPLAKLNIGHGGHQLHLRNNEGGENSWYIGASEDDWLSGDNLLLFSPTTGSNSGVFRLMDITDNNGIIAPVIIQSAADQVLLMDGNEIDSRFGPLHFNYNSMSNTIFNTNDGNVGIGTNTPGGKLHVKGDPGSYTLTMERGSNEWNFQPFSNTENLGFIHNDVLVAHIDDMSGAWVALSDKRYKENIRDIEVVLPGVNSLELKSYFLKNVEEKERQLGFMAQDIRKVFPAATNEDEEGNLTVAYSQLSAIAIKALQEQNQQIIELEKELESLIEQWEAVNSNHKE